MRATNQAQSASSLVAQIAKLRMDFERKEDNLTNTINKLRTELTTTTSALRDAQVRCATLNDQVRRLTALTQQRETKLSYLAQALDSEASETVRSMPLLCLLLMDEGVTYHTFPFVLNLIVDKRTPI